MTDQGTAFTDCGTFSPDSIDYPEIAVQVCVRVQKEKDSAMGILVCGTGAGMSMAANKIRGIRAALCCDPYTARMTRAHNDANVLCLGERVVGTGLALDIVDTFLGGTFEGGRHKRRVDKICGIEENEQ